MKYRILLCSLVFIGILTTNQAAAQVEIGASVGYTRNWLTTSSAYHYDRYYDARGGITAAIPVRYRFNKWFALQAEVAYTQKNYAWHRSDRYFINNNQSYRNSYLQLPILANFSFGGESLRGFVNLGGYIGVWIDSHTKGNFQEVGELYSFDFDERIPFDSKRDNRFEAGLIGGIGLEYRISKKVCIFAEGRYQYSLTDMQKRYMIDQMPRYNNTFTIQLGALVRLKK